MIKKTVDHELTKEIVESINDNGILTRAIDRIPYISMKDIKNPDYQKLIDVVCKYLGNIKAATMIAVVAHGPIYIAHNYDPDTQFDFYIRLADHVDRYFNIQQGICYEISDDEVNNDPDFYQWILYRKYFLNKSIAVEKLHVFYSDDLMDTQ